MITDIGGNAVWAIRSTYHMVLKSKSGAAIFNRDLLFDIPYIVDWNDIVRRRQEKVNKENNYENLMQLPFDCAKGGTVLIREDGSLRKAELKISGALYNHTSALQWYIAYTTRLSI